MIKNYFRTAWRCLLKNKVTSFINIFGLSVGMTAAVFIFLWVQNEFTVDGYHPNKENIYRITNAIQISKQETWTWEASPMLLAGTATAEIPGIKQASRLVSNSWGGPVLKANNQFYSGKTSVFVDKNWFRLFKYDFVAGNKTAFENDPFSIVLTETKAREFFGNTNPVGQVMRVDTVNYTVRAVVMDNPVNSSFQFDVLMQMGGRLANPATLKNDQSWNNFGYISFVELHPQADVASVSTKLNAIIDKNRTNDNNEVSLQPLQNMHFETNLQSSELPHGNKRATYIFSLLGLLLMITACINYVNLTTAKAGLRSREVSVRKIVGASRNHLFFQFITESVIISLVALGVTLVLLQVCLPLFNSITGKTFLLPASSLTMWKVLIATLSFAALLNGLYPAILLSSFKPLNVLRGKSILRATDGSVRRGLVVFQFSLSITLIIGTLVIYRQLNYIQTSNPGYNLAQVMSIQVPYRNYEGKDEEQKKSFFSGIRQQLLANSGIDGVSNASNEIVNVTSASSGNADWDGRDTSYNPTIAQLRVDADFMDLFRLEVIAGNWFQPGKDKRNYILNETAAESFHLRQPFIGQRFTWGGDTGQIVGIVRDFHFKSLHEKIGPMVMAYNDGGSSYFFIKSKPGNTQKAVAAAAAVWRKNIPGEPFVYNFLDDSFNTLYKADIKTSTLIFIFSIITVIISALGLFGLASFTAEQRTREIGIRKVLGATVQHITTLLSKEFLKLVIISIIIASPIAGWLMSNWLQDFAYRINITAGVFIAAAALALTVALLSVSIQAIKAAVANPVKSLRTDF